jgi:hypothetical protein
MPEQPQTADVSYRTVIITAGGIIGFLILVLVVLSLVFPQLIHRPAPAVAQFPAPSVTVDERTQRIQLERAQKERLTGKNGTMAIERAMAVIAAKGASAFEPVGSGAP